MAQASCPSIASSICQCGTKVDDDISSHSSSQLHVVSSQYSIPPETVNRRYLKIEDGSIFLWKEEAKLDHIFDRKRKNLSRECSRISVLPQRAYLSTFCVF